MDMQQPAVSLVVRSGKFKGQRFPLFGGMVVGRGEQAHLYLPDFKASRRHARIRATDVGFELEDLDSHNGTFLNGERVSRAELHDGDVVHIGATRLEVVSEDRSEEAIIASFAASAPGMMPTIVRRVDLQMPPTLDELPAEDYFSALGIPSPGEVREADPEFTRRILTKTRNFAIVYEISKALGSAVDVRTLLARAMDYILKVIGADRGYIILVDPENGDLMPGVAMRRGQPAEDGGGGLEISHTIIDWVIRERSAVVSSDASTDQRFEEKKSIVLYNIRSVLCMPMMHGNRVVGVIQLDSLGSGLGFTEDDLELLGVIAPVLAVAVENTRLLEQREHTIQELRAAHELLVCAQEQLVAKEKMAVVGRFTSGLTHEIRNLMGPFMLADLLQAEYPDDERIQEYSSLMLEAYNRVGSLVEEIRLLARGEQPDLELAEHDLADTVRGVLRFVRCDQEARRHRLLSDCGEIARFPYDEDRVKQVLINLIRNASQAMERPGDITIRTRVDPDLPGMARIEVVDQGVGIPPEMQARIWEPFFSTKAATGTGLGLDLCRGIVERHGGWIVCESTVGVGTTMIVLLPMEPPPTPEG